MSSHAESAPHGMHAPTGFVSKYIFSLDHKVIGIQYFLLALVAVCLGIVLSVLMRFHLVSPTAPQSGLGNYFLPIQIGAADMAFPRLNMLSFWTTFLAFVAIVAAFFVP